MCRKPACLDCLSAACGGAETGQSRDVASLTTGELTLETGEFRTSSRNGDSTRAGIAALALAGFALFGRPAAVTGQGDSDGSAMLLTIPSDSVSFMVGGVIVSLETGDPIAGAQVFLAGTTVGTLTDRSGRFRLDLTAGATMRLTVRLIGYRQVCYNVELLEGAMQSIGIRLTMSQLPPNQVDPTGCRDPEIDPRSPP